MSKYWYMSSSDDYLSGYENEEFSLNAVSAFEEVLMSSPESYQIKVNGIDDIGIVQDKDAREVKQLLTRLDTVKRGDQITYRNHEYLVLDFVDDNKMHQSTEIRVCNEIAKFEFKTIETIVDRDSKGRPIYEYIDQPPLLLPAIVEKTNVVESLNESINIDEDRVKVTISYRDLDTAEYFKVYNEKFKIVSRDKTKSINGVGLLILIGERSAD